MRAVSNGNGRIKNYQTKIEFKFKKPDSSVERAILATLVEAITERNNKVINLLLREVKKDYFLADPLHPKLWEALTEYLLHTGEGEWHEITLFHFLRNKDLELWSLANELLYENPEAVAPEILDSLIRILKDTFLINTTLSGLLEGESYKDAKELLKKLQDSLDALHKEISDIKTKESQNEIEDLFLTIDDLENIQIDWLVKDFIPKNTIVGITAKFSTGKTTLVYALLKTFVLQKYKVLYVDLDNPLTVIKKKIEEFGFKEFVESGQLKILSRHKLGINARHEAWQRIKEWLMNQEEHYLVVIDSLKNFAKGYDINSDKEAEFLMSELKDLTVKHTVIYLHHIPKMLNPDMPFKNSGTILDNTDVAYFLQTDKKARLFKLTRFKDRVPVKESLEFIFNEDGTLEEALPEWIREALKFVRAVFEEVEKGNNKKKALTKAVAEKTGIGEKRVTNLLEQYAQYRYWEIVQGEHNSKIIKPLKTLEEIESSLKSKAYANSVENQELGNDSSRGNAQVLENQELGSCATIYIEEHNCAPESDTLKSEEESIKGMIERLLDDGVEINLEVMTVHKVDTEKIREIAKDPVLKSLLLELYIANEKGDVNGWEYLIEEVKEGKKTFKEAIETFEELSGIDF